MYHPSRRTGGELLSESSLTDEAFDWIEVPNHLGYSRTLKIQVAEVAEGSVPLHDVPTQAYQFTDQPDLFFDAALLDLGNSLGTETVPVNKNSSPRRSARNRSAFRQARSLSHSHPPPSYSEAVNSSASREGFEISPVDSSHLSTSLLPYKWGTWPQHHDLVYSQVDAQQPDDIPFLTPNCDPSSGITACSWKKSKNHAYPLQKIDPEIASEPLWMQDYMDDFGVTGTRMGSEQTPCVIDSKESAGLCLSLSPVERTQPLNQACVQQNFFNLSFLPQYQYGMLDNSLNMLGIGGQGVLQPVLEQIPPDLDQLLVLPVEEDPLAAIFKQQNANTTIPEPTQIGDIISLPPYNSNPDNHQHPPLNVLHDNGFGDLTTEVGAKRHLMGRRGPLPKEKALKVAKIRREKNVCIPCRMKKVSCTGGSGGKPCSRCLNLAQITFAKQPCLKAHFVEIIQGGSCNYFSQRQIDHLTINGTKRITKMLPERIDFNNLLSLVGEHKARFNIGAFSNPRDGPLWTLNLSHIFGFLTRLSQQRSNLDGEIDFRSFLDNELPGALGWEKCVNNLDPDGDLLAVLHQWNQMPSRVSFSLMPTHSSGFPKPLDIENPTEEELLFLAAQLSRIVCRTLENMAFESLQKALNKQEIFKHPHEAKALVFQLGLVLLQFRWRIAWWKLSGDGDHNDTLSKQRYIARLERLTMVLYFYFCSAKAKLPSYVAEKGLSGTQSFHTGATPFFDKFPHENSIPGWEDWLEEGKGLVRRAQEEKLAAKVNPYPEHVVDKVV